MKSLQEKGIVDFRGRRSGTRKKIRVKVTRDTEKPREKFYKTMEKEPG